MYGIYSSNRVSCLNLENLFYKKYKIPNMNKVYLIDIDGTICDDIPNEEKIGRAHV